ncbi:MAG: peptidylprolyl isomerase [Candidatus Paceibacterota bacterium]|jgi:cyclophilin family peptidyl-prolyl cis-trans isomerase
MEETGLTKITLLSIITILIVGSLIGGSIYLKKGEGSDMATSSLAMVGAINNQASSTNQQTTMPEITIDKNKNYSVVLHTTEGDIAIELAAQATPVTVNNFVTLAKKDFYNGTIFHRVIKGFMIQGGDPTGTGMGGPGYKFNDEPFAGEYTRGTVAMANAGPNTNGSQFFIMHADVPLPKAYVIFGKVISGMETVDKIATAPVKAGGENSSPINPVKVTSVEVIEK